MVFMELVYKSKDVTLYRYGHCNARCPKTKQRVHNYYLYKGNDLHLATTNIKLPIAFKEAEVLRAYKYIYPNESLLQTFGLHMLEFHTQ